MARWVIVVMLACGCGGGSSSTDAAVPDGPEPCSRGDDCSVAANTGCDVDDRCAVIQLGTCYFPACQPPGEMQLGDACTLSNNEGAEYWDSCGASMVCYRGVCTQACTLSISEGGCPTPALCMQDPDVGAFMLGVCM